MLSKTESKRMSDTATADHAEPLTLEKVYRELQVLRERVEDLEDLRDLGLQASVPTEPRRCVPGPVADVDRPVRRHPGDDPLALAGLWEVDPANMRADMQLWVEELMDQGLLVADQGTHNDP